ncbi:hypothetical protein TSST111916_05100 [Tsukamurella strandjordii]|uniref:hypothetical protein n=1 Tax=Tsukamurella TaxID=2060 RepID=UPI001C7DB64E|nr:hypothetical protein [Tsukamurella sp. TY48]GIZ97305.1 hypothetical protein TTY48_19170 [Tsukamurella sp. TY48]
MNGCDVDPLDRPELRALVVDLAEAAYTGRVTRWNELRTTAAVHGMDLEYLVCGLLGRLLAERATRRGEPAVDAWSHARSSLV